MQREVYHFRVIFESMSNRLIGGIIDNAERYDRHTENAHFQIGGKNERIKKRNEDHRRGSRLRKHQDRKYGNADRHNRIREQANF